MFDIQDIGARFYTYVSTMGEAMKACAEQGKRFVVLDRPNPIGGVAVAGPMLDAGRESFVGFHRLPVRHGMTIGELARLFQDELKLKLDLQVIECVGWRRADAFDAHRTDLGQSLAQHAEPDAGVSLSGHRPVGDDESLRRPRHRHAV